MHKQHIHAIVYGKVDGIVILGEIFWTLFLHTRKYKFCKGDKIFQRGSKYFKHFCTGWSKYFNIFGLGEPKLGVQFFATGQLLALDNGRGNHQSWNKHIQLVVIPGRRTTMSESCKEESQKRQTWSSIAKFGHTFI